MIAGDKRATLCHPGRLMSLYDMITGDLSDLVNMVLRIKEDRIRLSNAGGVVSEGLRVYLTESIAYYESILARQPMPAAKKKLDRLKKSLVSGAAPNEIFQRNTVFWETIDDDASGVRFYRYPPERAKLLDEFETDWEPTLKSFPSSRKDIIDGIDCYACGHPTACVFHMVRVAERGLRAIARERGIKAIRNKKAVAIERAQWSELTRELAKVAKDIELTWKPSRNKDEAMTFYMAAHSHMDYLRVAYRNDVSHVRTEYTDNNAVEIMRHTRLFMNTMSIRLSESGKRIRWKK